MHTHQEQTSKFERLRKEAEALIARQPDVKSEKTTDFLELIHELRVYQAELEIQNEELKQAQQEISDLHREYEDLYEFAPCGYLTLNDKGMITHANLTAVNMLGVDRQHLLRSGFTQMIAPGWEQALLTARQKAGETREKQTVELPLKKAPELSAWIRLDITADCDSTGAVISWRLLLTDITAQRQAETDKKQLEDQLRHSQKIEAIGTLAGGIAHDFNNILSSIIGFTELAIDDVEKGTSLEDSLQEVFKAGIRAKALVGQILILSRHDSLEFKPVSINTVVKESLKMLRATIPSSINIQKTICNRELVAYADAMQLHQVIMNLTTNAKQAMPETGGELVVSVDSIRFDEGPEIKELVPGNYARITVSDNGIGIKKEFLEKIFEPYFTTKKVGEGSGLGLSVVYGIVKSHSGAITTQSEPGKGTTFCVYLPLSDQRKIEDLQTKDAPIQSGTEHILLVDDELSIVKMHRQLLERLGYKVMTSTSSVEALETFRSFPHKFDLVITDMTMPDMTGDKLAVELMKIRQDIPVILCTGYSNTISDKTAADIGIKAFAYKPVSKADLAKIVRKVLDETKK